MSGAPVPMFRPESIRSGAPWLSGAGADADVVISSRVRLARNVAGLPSVCRASREQRQAVLDLVQERLPLSGIAGQLMWVNVHKASPLDRTFMVERHLISKEHARGGATHAQSAQGSGAGGGAGGASAGIQVSGPGIGATPTTGQAESATPGGAQAGSGSAASAGAAAPVGGAANDPRGVAISLPDENISIMVNEEDHLRMQVLRSGLELGEAYRQANEVDDRLEGACPGAKDLEFAFSARFGYLTACPTNVGTGIRVSVMLHLPALKLAGEMDKVRRATRDMALAVRGYYGEGSEAAGELFQISNQTTLGKSESIILHEFEKDIIPQVIQYERVARRMLMEKRRRMLEDKVFRALGTLRHARLLTPEEALTLLSDLRLGILCGLVADVAAPTVNQLMLLTQPAHLQRLLGREMDQNERREARADLVRERLSV